MSALYLIHSLYSFTLLYVLVVGVWILESWYMFQECLEKVMDRSEVGELFTLGGC